MDNDELVSIIVPAYRSGKFIEKCIDNILNQTYSTVELIVIYSSSPNDNTLDILKKYNIYKNLRVIKSDVVLSASVARNVGLENANGNYIAFCDADDFFAHDKIEKQINYLKKNRDVGLVYTDTIMVDIKGNEVNRHICPEWDREMWLSHRFITFSSVLTTKEMMDKVGCLDERLVRCMDFDLLIRLSNATTFKRIPEFLTYYTLHPGNISKQKVVVNLNRAQVFRKHRMWKKYLHSIFWIIPRSILRQKLKETPIIYSFYSNYIKHRSNRRDS